MRYDELSSRTKDPRLVRTMHHGWARPCQEPVNPPATCQKYKWIALVEGCAETEAPCRQISG